jgi:hypothetical protein
VSSQPSSPLPPEAAGLGEFRLEVSGASSGRRDFITGAVLLVVFVAIAVFALTHTDEDQIVLGAVFMTLLVLGCAAFMVYGFFRMGDRFFLFADGFVVVSWRRAKACRWDEVVWARGLVPMPVPTPTGKHYFGSMAIGRRDGAVLNVPHSLDRLDDLSELIYEKVLAVLLPPARGAILRGEAVVFGTLRVDRKGASWDSKRVAWADAELLLTGDRIIIRDRTSGESWTGAAGTLPNVPLLRELMREIQSGVVK